MPAVPTPRPAFLFCDNAGHGLWIAAGVGESPQIPHIPPLFKQNSRFPGGMPALSDFD
jgi:hypothetical protein